MKNSQFWALKVAKNHHRMPISAKAYIKKSNLHINHGAPLTAYKIKEIHLLHFHFLILKIGLDSQEIQMSSGM